MENSGLHVNINICQQKCKLIIEEIFLIFLFVCCLVGWFTFISACLFYVYLLLFSFFICFFAFWLLGFQSLLVFIWFFASERVGWPFYLLILLLAFPELFDISLVYLFVLIHSNNWNFNLVCFNTWQ